jgi:apolipoprotein N-acyltransferase
MNSSTSRLAFLGAVLLWAAFPPLDLWPLAWIAPVPWLLLIRREKLDGRRPYRVLWLAGLAFWLAVLHWLRLPYWATAFGWLALSFYFAFYVPVFIALSRVAVHQLRLPVILAAPLVWTGLELARAHLLTGMTMASLAHTQYRWVGLIQISDLAGAYAVSFLVMFVAACFARMLPCEGRQSPGTVPIMAGAKMGLSPSPHPVFWPLLPAAAILAAALGYGYARTAHNNTTPGLKVALIQGSIDTKFGDSADPREYFKHYFDLSKQAADKYGQLDLVVWPETYFIYPLVIYGADAGTDNPALQAGGIGVKEYQDQLQTAAENSQRAFQDTAAALDSPMLVGLEAWHCAADSVQRLNSAAYISASGKVLGCYDKMHLVMFGEYIPFADSLTWLYGLSPLAMATTPGAKPAAFQVGDVRIAPNICYESVFPHFIRWQINTLAAEGREPDVLINLTNDGWFWGSSELDLHLACAVFRAVEFRKPFLIAANTGFSAWIDADGRIIAKGPRRSPATLLARVRIDHRRSPYLYYGDWPAGLCLAACCVIAGSGLWRRWRKQHSD